MLVMVFSLSIMAQKQSYIVAKKEFNGQTAIDIPASNNATAVQAIKPNPHKKVLNEDLKLYPFGTSRNGFSTLTTNQRCLWYDKTLDAVTFSFRGNDKATATPTLGTGNDIVASISTDRGVAWNSKIIASSSGTKLYRYPSGVLINPVGNTNIDNAAHLVVGPTTVSSVWSEYFLASKLYDGSGANVQSGTMPSGAPGILRDGLYVCEDGMVHVAGTAYKTTGPQGDTRREDFRIIIRNGSYNSTTKSVDWLPEVVIYPSVYFLNQNTWGDFVASDPKMAWSNDGSVGYLMVTGADSRGVPMTGTYPIIYKSTDKGTTWDLLPYFNFGTLQSVIDTVQSIDPKDPNAPVYPSFDDADLTISADGSLNVMAMLTGESASTLDSLNYYYPYELANAFNFIYDGTTWSAYHIGGMETLEATADVSKYIQTTTGGGGVAYDSRIHAVRSYDGKNIFALWTNTLEANAEQDVYDINPDLFVWGYKIGTDNVLKMMDEPKCVSTWTEADQVCYFMYASPICMDIADGYEFPVTIEDIATTSYNADEPCIHNYMKNVIVTNDLFTVVAVKPVKEAFATVSGNYPNPFTGMTQFDITLKKTSPVSVTVSTITGQKVFTKNYGVIAVGQKETLIIDASNLKGGIYIYTVTAGESKSSHKMIVR